MVFLLMTLLVEKWRSLGWCEERCGNQRLFYQNPISIGIGIEDVVTGSEEYYVVVMK